MTSKFVSHEAQPYPTSAPFSSNLGTLPLPSELIVRRSKFSPLASPYAMASSSGVVSKAKFKFADLREFGVNLTRTNFASDSKSLKQNRVERVYLVIIKQQRRALAKEHFYLFYLKALLRGAVLVSGQEAPG